MKQETEAVIIQEKPQNLLQVIAAAVADPRCDVDKMERLLAMQQQIIADERRTAFMAAMARVAVKVPAITQKGQSHHGAYARLEDIDRVIRPILSEEGLSLSFDSIPSDGKVRVICKLSHAAGHFELKQIDLPLDNSGSKNGAQSVISTVSYGRRALTKMFFNLIESGEDTDGNNPTAITDDEAKDLQCLIDEVKADKAGFLKYMNVASLGEILKRDFKKAVTALEAKRRRK